MSVTSKKLLIIDDEPDLLFILSMRLKNRGYDVDTVCEHKLAIDMISVKDYEVIFCDLSMPGNTNCFDILKFVKSRGKACDFYIITGHTEGSKLLQNALKEVEANKILVKPLDFKQILSILEH